MKTIGNKNGGLAGLMTVQSCSPFQVSLVQRGVIFILLLGVAAWSVGPVLRAPSSVIPATNHGIGTVPLFNAWTILWNADRLRNGFADYWNAPIFHPVRGAFAFSEPQPATLLVAPVVWGTASVALAYNAYLLISLVLNGLFSMRLMTRLQMPWLSRLIAGIAMVLHPLAHAQGDVLQLMPLWPILWTIAATIDLRSAVTKQQPASSLRQWRTVLLKGTELGVAYSSVFAVSVHHGLFFTLLTACSIWVFVPWTHLRRWLPGAVAALIVAVGLLMPLLFPMFRILQQYKFDRTESLVAELSAQWSDFLVVSPTAFFRLPDVSENRSWHLLPGWCRTVLALLAVNELRAHAKPHVRRAVAYLLLTAIVSMLLSLGTNLQIAGWKPWLTLSQWCPGMSHVRSAFRFGYFFQLCVILLCAVGFDTLTRWLGRIRPAGKSWAGLATCLLAIIGIFLSLEVPPSPVKVIGVPNLSQVFAWQSFLRTNLAPGKCVIFLPYAEGESVRHFDTTTRWMLRTTQQHIPVLNGYSGFFPQSHFDHQKVFNNDPFSPASLERMVQSEVQYVAIQDRQVSAAAEKGAGNSAHRLELVHHDISGTMIFQLQSTLATGESAHPAN